MNLTTHGVLAFLLGIMFFHNVPVALIMTVGALIPDLDREYFFIIREKIEEYQLHRSLFHNFLWIGFLYLLNPFLALGALSHSLLDSFTTATDRGVELLFPFTRLTESYYYDINGDKKDNSKKRKWWVEDPWTLLKKTSDRDLQEPTHQPWRRSYGPFKNSRIVDWALFFGSIVFLIVLYFTVSGSYSIVGYNNWLVGSFLGIAIFYVLGELYRSKLKKEKDLVLRGITNLNERERIMHKTVREMLTPLGVAVLTVLIAGLAVFIYSGIIGGIFLFKVPSTLILTLFAYGLVSLLVGFIAARVWLTVKKNDDHSM
jgi:hypothetical protein